MAIYRLLLEYEFLFNETDPNEERISTNYYAVHEWVFDSATKLAYQLPDRQVGADVYGPTPNGGDYYSRPTEEEFYDDCDGTTYRGYYHNGAGGVTVLPEANSAACNYTPPATAGTVLRFECRNAAGATGQPDSFDRYRIEANGTGGERAVLVQRNATACNYVPPAPVPGCTDPEATNYDPNATQDDGSCAYVPRLVPSTVPRLAAVGRPLLFSLQSAETGRPGSRARLLITVSSNPVVGTNLIMEGETFVVVAGTPGPGQFNSGITLSAQLAGSITLSARYRISQPDPASVELVALVEGAAFTPVVGVDDQDGGVDLTLTYGVDALRSQTKKQWGCYAEIWAVPTAVFGGAVELGSAYLVDRVEQLYRAGNYYEFDLSPALLPLVGHSLATTTDRLVAYFVRYGEAYVPEGETLRRRMVVADSPVCWGLESALAVPALATALALSAPMPGGLVPVGRDSYTEQAYLLGEEGVTLRAELATRTATGQLSVRAVQAPAAGGAQALALAGLLTQLPASALWSQLTYSVDGVEVGRARLRHAPARACLQLLGPGGAYETVWLAGLTDPTPKRASQLYARGTSQAVRRVELVPARKCATHPLSRAGLDWLCTTLAGSPEVQLVSADGELEPMVVTNWNPDYNEAENRYSLTFELEPAGPTYTLSN